MQFIGFLLIINILIDITFGGSLKFSNLKCQSLDTNFSDFTKCDLKVLRRGVVGLNIVVKLFKIPVTNASINLALYKKLNGYRPFLYNQTLDFCDFMKHRKRFQFYNIFHSIFMKSSNINHTCPYDHDIIVNKLELKEDSLKLMPLPTGSYMFQMVVGAYNVWRADVKAYVDQINDLDF